MHKIGNFTQAVTSVISAIMLLVLSSNVLFQIVSREIIKYSCAWAEEVARFSFIWCALLAASILVRKRRHFLISIFIDLIKNKKIVKALHIISHISVIFVAGCLFYFGIQYAIMGLGNSSPILQMKMTWVFAAIPVSSLLMIFYTIELLLTDLGILSPITAEEMDLVSLSKIFRKGVQR